MADAFAGFDARIRQADLGQSHLRSLAGTIAQLTTEGCPSDEPAPCPQTANTRTHDRPIRQHVLSSAYWDRGHRYLFTLSHPR